jgi:hypothetical protein
VAKYTISLQNYLQSKNWITIAKWIATVLFIFSGGVLALNIDISRWGFVTFFVAHILLVVVFNRIKDYPMLLQNAFFIIVDVIGIYRWFLT